MMKDLYVWTDDEADAKAKELISDHRQKAIKSQIEQMVDDEFDRLGEYAGEYLSRTATDRAERFIERVLQGDEDAAKQLIGAGDGRYKAMGYDQGKPWASVIHGTIFETGAVKLRRQIVETHTDLIRNEHIADLEATVEGLRQQILKIESQLNDPLRHMA